jgi:hypothetical protein
MALSGTNVYEGLDFWCPTGFVSEWAESCRSLALQRSGGLLGSYHLSKVDDVIAFILNFEWPTVCGALEVDEECRSIDLNIHSH